METVEFPTEDSQETAEFPMEEGSLDSAETPHGTAVEAHQNMGDNYKNKEEMVKKRMVEVGEDMVDKMMMADRDVKADMAAVDRNKAEEAVSHMEPVEDGIQKEVF